MFDLSVILPTRNRADALLKALVGIERNSHCGYEVIVIDGASTDTTGQVLRLAGSIMGRRLRTIREGTCVGLGAALAKGIATARGRNVAILHDDVHPLDNALDRAVRQLDEDDSAERVIALFAAAGGRTEPALERVLAGRTYSVGHLRGTIVAHFPVASRSVFERCAFDMRWQTSVAMIDWSLAAWDCGLKIVPAIDSILETHFDEAAGSQQEVAEYQRMLSSWNLPPVGTAFDSARPCRITGRRSGAAAA